MTESNTAALSGIFAKFSRIDDIPDSAEIKPICNVEGSGMDCGLGYCDGRLIGWDESQYFSLTLRESAEFYAIITDLGNRAQAGESSCGEALLEWLNEVVAALPDGLSRKINASSRRTSGMKPR